MKKQIMFLALLLTSLSAGAQTAQVESIREAYAAAKETIALQEQFPSRFYCSKTEIVSDYITDGNGPTHEVIQYFYQGDWDESLDRIAYTPFLITRRYNVGTDHYYEEYLFDENSYELIFFYQKQGEANETRYYWRDGKLVDEKVKGARGTDAAFAQRYSNQYWDVFMHLMNSTID